MAVAPEITNGSHVSESSSMPIAHSNMQSGASSDSLDASDLFQALDGASSSLHNNILQQAPSKGALAVRDSSLEFKSPNLADVSHPNLRSTALQQPAYFTG
jgi:hypothetical protein